MEKETIDLMIKIIWIAYLIISLLALYEVSHLDRYFKNLNDFKVIKTGESINNRFVIYVAVFICSFLPVLQIHFAYNGIIRIGLNISIFVLKTIAYICGVDAGENKDK